MQITLKPFKENLFDQDKIIAKQKVAHKNLWSAYEEALKFSNLVLEHEIHTRNIRIYEKQHIHEIYTNTDPKSQLPHLVMLHGYGGSALTYVRTFQHLKSYYQVHALDSFGVGLSSLGNYSEKFTQAQVKHYYVDAIQKWRKALNINKFTLVGHSFGGYIATLYSEKYPQNVKRLVLLSPAGATQKTNEEIQKQIQKRKNQSFRSKIFLCLAQKLYNLNIRPSKLISSYFIGNYFLEKITGDRLKLKDQQKEAWKKYLTQITKKPKNSQTGFYKLFEWPVRPKRAIEKIIRENSFKMPIEFYFGDIDWMDNTGAKRIVREYKNVKMQICNDAGHQMIFDNPAAVVAKILRQDRNDKYQEEQVLKSQDSTFNPETSLIKNEDI